MPTPGRRPPSERGVQYELLDALAEAREDLADLRRALERVRDPVSNWWDVLPADAERWLPKHGSYYPLVLMQGRPDLPAMILQVAYLEDRLELTLRDGVGIIHWQRALFYQPPFGGNP